MLFDLSQLFIHRDQLQFNPYNPTMPTISMFYGILVSMFFEDTDRHHLAHIHVRYAGDKAAIAIEDGRVLAGGFPPKQLKMVQAWIEIHKDELLGMVCISHPIECLMR
jgi:hypothetical protein